jgi:hypothetical protein
MRALRDRARKRTLNLRSNSFTISKAKTYLGRLLEKASKGEPVYIVRGEHQFILQHVPPIDPIPMRPPGYFASQDSKEEMQEENRLAKSSVICAPNDLE